MNEQALHISSLNRERRGKNVPQCFIIKFSPPLYLEEEKQ